MLTATRLPAKIGRSFQSNGITKKMSASQKSEALTAKFVQKYIEKY